MRGTATAAISSCALLTLFALGPAAAGCVADCEDTPGCTLTLTRPDARVVDAGDSGVRDVFTGGPRDAAIHDGSDASTQEPPVAIISAPTAVFLGQPIRLDGSASYDPGGRSMTFAWRLIERPAGSDAPLLGRTSIEANITADAAGDFLVELLVNNGDRESAPARARIEVQREPRPLTSVLSGATWNIVQDAAGIAADSTGRVFVADDDNVYVVENAVVDVYLTADEAGAPGGHTFADIADVDLDENDTLYVLVETSIVESTAPHTAQLHTELTNFRRMLNFGVASRDLIGVVEVGFWVIDQGMVSQLYMDPVFNGNSGCAVADLAMHRSGVFLYGIGCNGSPIMKGDARGGGAEILFDTAPFGEPPPPFDATNYLCAARDPTGGFAVYIADTSSRPHLMNFSEEGDWYEIPTSPTLAEAKADNVETFAFDYCSIAVAPDGTIYFQTRSQLWRID